jgi:hypothetical protein
MNKKELGLGLLLLVISAVTGAINPAFLSLVNLLNMANLIGLFGVFALGEGLHDAFAPYFIYEAKKCRRAKMSKSRCNGQFFKRR